MAMAMTNRDIPEVKFGVLQGLNMFDAGKTGMIGLPYGEKNYDDMLSRFHLIRDTGTSRTDRRTD